MRRLAGFALALVACATATTSVLVHPAPVQTREVQPVLDPAFEQLVDRYLKEVRGGGGRSAAADMSAGSFATQVETERGLLRELQAIDRKTLGFDQDIDYRFLESLLKGNITRHDKVKRWQQDPRAYIDTRSLSYNLEADPRAPAQRALEIIQDLSVLQARLANGKKNLNQHLPRWVELATAMLDGELVIFEKQIPSFADRLAGDQRAALLAETAKAVAALRDYRTFMASELPKKPAGDYKVGVDVYNALHEGEYLFDDN